MKSFRTNEVTISFPLITSSSSILTLVTAKAAQSSVKMYLDLAPHLRFRWLFSHRSIIMTGKIFRRFEFWFEFGNSFCCCVRDVSYVRITAYFLLFSRSFNFTILIYTVKKEKKKGKRNKSLWFFTSVSPHPLQPHVTARDARFNSHSHIPNLIKLSSNYITSSPTQMSHYL